MRQYFHYCSKGFRHEILFADTEEFIAGMNRVALCVLLSILKGHEVYVISFCLMDNHVHFILCGTREACDAFAADYKRLTGIYVQHRRGTGAYVLRNPVAAHMKTTVPGYRWGTGNLAFSDNSSLLVTARTGGDIGVKEGWRLFHSKLRIPEDWLVLQDGMIWTGSYVRTEIAERMFEGPGEYMFMLNDRKIDGKVNEEMLGDKFSLPDKEVRAMAKELAGKLFGKEFVSHCTAKERLDLARRLHREVKCGSKQLARVIRLDPDLLAELV